MSVPFDATVRISSSDLTALLGHRTEQPTAADFAGIVLDHIAFELLRHKSGDPTAPTTGIDDLADMASVAAQLIRDWPTEKDAQAELDAILAADRAKHEKGAELQS
jgi:hypothetical protein